MPSWRAVAVVHPYPSALNAAVTGLLALLAGGPPARAATLSGAMLLLQFAIGAANDWADARADAISRPGKPIVRGIVGRETAARIARLCAAGGLALSATAGPLVATVALGGLLSGLAYDFGVKGTAWAWLPFSVGFVLLPIFAWLGGSGATPPFLGWLVLLALPAGAIVALANGLVDLEADVRSGRRGPAGRLGRTRTAWALLLLEVALVAGVVASLFVARSYGLTTWLGVGVGGGLLGTGSTIGRGLERRRRLLGWQVQALGLAVLASSWFAGMVFS